MNKIKKYTDDTMIKYFVLVLMIVSPGESKLLRFCIKRLFGPSSFTISFSTKYTHYHVWDIAAQFEVSDIHRLTKFQKRAAKVIGFDKTSQLVLEETHCSKKKFQTN